VFDTLADSRTMIGRCLRLTSRNGEAVITALMLPIMLMLVFVYLFGGAINTGTAYVTYVTPGIILLCAAILTGHVVASVARNLASTVLVFGVAFLIGFRPHAGPLDWIAAGGVLLMFILALSWMSAAVGLLAKTPEGASGFTFFVTFLPYASSAFVPVDTMPSWIRGFAENQPVTPVTESIRSLLLNEPVGSAPWLAVAWCGGILVVSVVLSTVLFRRRTT
jgi:ABC-2 type transport system permease protein